MTLVNDSSLPVNVDVRQTDGGARLLLDTVQPSSSASMHDVIDQGGRWIFSFSSGGVEGGSVEVSRTKLAADGWRLRIPADVIRRLQAGEFVPSYR